MIKNVILFDRVVRFALGVFLLAWAIGGGPGWAYFGLYLLATGAWGYCPLYALLGIRPRW